MVKGRKKELTQAQLLPPINPLPAPFHAPNLNPLPGQTRQDILCFLGFVITIVIFIGIGITLIKVLVRSGYMTREELDGIINDIKLQLAEGSCGGNGSAYADYIRSFNNLIDNARYFMYILLIEDPHILIDKFDTVVDNWKIQYREISNYTATNGPYKVLCEVGDVLFGVLQPMIYKIGKGSIQFAIGLLAMTAIVIVFTITLVAIWQLVDKYVDWIIHILLWTLILSISGLCVVVIVASWVNALPDCDSNKTPFACAIIHHIDCYTKGCPHPEPNWNYYGEEHAKQIFKDKVPKLGLNSTSDPRIIAALYT